ncbi:MAG: ABA4-like family protein [Roseiflexaceae bacterium]
MSIEGLFQLANLGVLPFWLMMIVLPTWSVTRRVIGSAWIALVPALIYVLLVLPQVGVLLPALSNPTAAGIAELLSTPAAATIGWVHFLAFDLLVGRWAYLDARERQIHPLIMAPVLLLIFMFGPLGYLSYLIIRAIASRFGTRS